MQSVAGPLASESTASWLDIDIDSGEANMVGTIHWLMRSRLACVHARHRVTSNAEGRQA